MPSFFFHTVVSPGTCCVTLVSLKSCGATVACWWNHSRKWGRYEDWSPPYSCHLFVEAAHKHPSTSQHFFYFLHNCFVVYLLCIYSVMKLHWRQFITIHMELIRTSHFLYIYLIWARGPMSEYSLTQGITSRTLPYTMCSLQSSF